MSRTRLLEFEHSRLAYMADFVLYAGAVLGLAAVLAVAGPGNAWLARVAEVAAGLAAWTLLEYLLHRFVLHGLQPFSRWHAEHHDRPRALICAPTAFSASLIALLVFVPCWLAFGLWAACSLLLGVLAGYLGYAVTHHATHHWRAGSPWLLRRKRWHALHHHAQTPGFYGVTSGVWDMAFGTAPRVR